MDATLQKFLTPLDQLLSTATLICVLQDIGLVSAALICLVLSVLLYNYIQSPLKSFPGPTATKFTNLWRLLNTANGNVHLTQMELHRKYGPAVRMGPNTLSVSDSTVIKTVYNASKPWTKVRSDHRVLLYIAPIVANGSSNGIQLIRAHRRAPCIKSRSLRLRTESFSRIYSPPRTRNGIPLC